MWQSKWPLFHNITWGWDINAKTEVGEKKLKSRIEYENH